MNEQWTSRQLDAEMPGQRQPPSVAFPEIMVDANRTAEAYLRSL
jgi:hypothetical protein